MKRREIGHFLVVDPRVCHGKLTFKDTRVPVETVLHRLARGRTVEAILADWPELTREAVEEAIDLAAAALTKQYAAKSGVPG